MVLLALAAIPVLDPGRGNAEQAKSGPSKGTVSGDVKTFLRVGVEDRGRNIPPEQLPMALALMLTFLPEKVEAGVVEVAGDHATLRLSDSEDGKTVHGSALFARQKGEWKIDVFWRSGSRP